MWAPPIHRVGNFRQKNNSAEDGIDGTNGYFRRNSGCSAEQKLSEFRSEPFRGRENSSEFRSLEQKYKHTLRITFQTLQRKRKQLWIPFRGTKLEASSRNFLRNSSAAEKTTRNSVTWNKNRSKLSEFRSELWPEKLCKFRKTSFFRGIPFHSVLFRASELALPRNLECLGMITFFRGITETILSLFRGIFLERNSVPNPTYTECWTNAIVGLSIYHYLYALFSPLR